MPNRIKYKNAPLMETIFQLQFPTILEINAEDPILFQKEIRNKFPYYDVNVEYQNEFVLTPNGEPSSVKQTAIKNHMFLSLDKTIKINLTSTFIAISTSDYDRWELFRNVISEVIVSFENVYKPQIYIREGLRYVDVIQREKLGLKDVSWTELLHPSALGFITLDNEDNTVAFMSEIEYKTSNGCMTRIKSGLVNINNNPENVFLLDNDHFTTDVLKPADVLIVANKLHDNSNNFIKGVISSKLEKALEPEVF